MRRLHKIQTRKRRTTNVRPVVQTTAHYYDDFYGFGDTPLHGKAPYLRPTGSTVTWSVNNGVVVMTNGYLETRFAANSTSNVTLDYPTPDGEFRLEWEFPTGGTARAVHILIRALDLDDMWHAQASIDQGSWRIIETVNNVWTNRQTATATFVANTRYAMTVSVDGDQMIATLYRVVDGVDVAMTMTGGSNILTHTMATPNSDRLKMGFRTMNTFATGAPIRIYKFESWPDPTPADSTVTVSGVSSVTSRTIPALSWITNPPIWFGNATGWSNAKTALASCVGAHKIHIFPFGLLDPWNSDASGPLEANPSLWSGNSRLSGALSKIREVDADDPIILTIYSASWFMKQKVSANNVVTDMVFSERFSADGRVKYAYLDEWLIMVDEAVEIAAAAPYGCRDFEIWNEAKGYYATYPFVGQTWDSSMDTGETDVAMGYGYFYKRTAEQVVATMTRLGHARNTYRIGGPYPVLSVGPTITADTIPSSHPLYQYRNQWGYANKAPINFTLDFLGHLQAGRIATNLFDYLTIDTSTNIANATAAQFPSSDPFDYTERFTHVAEYWRTQLAAYGFSSDLEMDWSEIYAYPPLPMQTQSGQETLRAAIWADTMVHCIKTCIRYPIMWGANGEAQGTNGSEGGLITSTATSSGGVIKRVGEIAKYFKDEFAPGTACYDVTSSDDRIGGLANATKAVLYNKTGSALVVDVEGTRYTFAAYETKLVTL